MKRKLLKKLLCLFGMLFITFPAWSAVPSNLLPDDGSWNQAPAIADVENPLLEGDMILAGAGVGSGGEGGNSTGGGSGRGTQSQTQEQTQEQAQEQVQEQVQKQTQEQIQEQTQVQSKAQNANQDGGSNPAQ